MKVKMLLKSGFGSIRHGDVVDAAPDDVRLGLQLGFLAPADAEAAALASRERERPESPTAGKSFADFCRAVNRRDSAYLARHYDSHFLPPDTENLSPRQKAALAESGGPTGGYTVPAEYAAGMMTVAAENAVIRPNATVAAMTSAALQVPYIDMTTPQAAGVSPYFGGVQMKWTGESQPRTETEPAFKQAELTAWELSGSAGRRGRHESASASNKAHHSISGVSAAVNGVMGADRPGSHLFPSTSPAQTPRPHGTLWVVRRSGVAAADARGRRPMTTRRRGHRVTLAHRRKLGKCQRLQRLTMRQMMRQLARHRCRWAPDRAIMVRQERKWNAVQDQRLARRQRPVRVDRLDGDIANHQALSG